MVGQSIVIRKGHLDISQRVVEYGADCFRISA